MAKSEVIDPIVRVAVKRENLRTREELPVRKLNVGGRMVKMAPIIEGSVNGERFAYECDRSHSMPYSHADAMRSGGWIDPAELAEVLAEVKGGPSKRKAPTKKPQASGAATEEAVAEARKKAKDAGIDAQEVDAMSAADVIALASDIGD